MVRVIKDSVVTARKDHQCDSCLWIRESLDHYGNPYTFAEWRLIAAAKKANWKILKGETYNKQVNTMDGYMYTFKSRPGLDTICHKYELFPEL